MCIRDRVKNAATKAATDMVAAVNAGKTFEQAAAASKMTVLPVVTATRQDVYKRQPRDCSSAPSAAEAMPFPREDTTPPVMKMKRFMTDAQFNDSRASSERPQVEVRATSCSIHRFPASEPGWWA